MKLNAKIMTGIGLFFVSSVALAQLPLLGNSTQALPLPALASGGSALGSFSFSDFPVYDLAPEELPENPLPGLGPLAQYTERGYTAGSGLYVLGYSVAGQEVDEISRPVDATGRPLAYTVFPVSQVAIENPEGLPDYFTGGGTIVYPGLSVLPGIPVVNRPAN